MLINYNVFSNDNKYINNLKKIYFLSIFLVFCFFLIWYIFYSEPYKIYSINKITPIQYKL